jgi:hypothetical protein
MVFTTKQYQGFSEPMLFTFLAFVVVPRDYLACKKPFLAQLPITTHIIFSEILLTFAQASP